MFGHFEGLLVGTIQATLDKSKRKLNHGDSYEICLYQCSGLAGLTERSLDLLKINKALFGGTSLLVGLQRG
jgi:hypothetical protein